MSQFGFVQGFSLMGPWSVALSVLALLVVLYGVYRSAGKQKLARRLEQLRAAGYPITFEELELRRKLPKGVPNAADLYLEAISCYQELPDDEKQMMPVIGDAQCPEEGQPYPAEQVKATQAFLEKNRQCLDLLYQAASVEKTCFERDYVKLSDVPPLADIRHMSILLAMDSLVHLENGDSEQVIRANTALIHFAESLVKGPLVLDCLTGIAIQGIGVAGFREGISRGLFSEQQLDRIRLILQDAKKCYDLKEVLVAEQCYTIQSTLYPEIFGITGFRVKLRYLAEKLAGLREINAAAMIDVYEQLSKVFDLPYQQQLENKDMVLQAEYDRLSPLCYEAKWLTAHFIEKETSFGAGVTISSLSILFECQAKLDAAIAACGVERYRLSHDGKLPQTLEELVSEYLEAVPFDPFNREFLKYEILPTGYGVYTYRDNQRNSERESSEQFQYSFKVSYWA